MSDAKLKQQIQEQMDRLITQLNDCEEMREELEDEEYENLKSDTIKQLREFEISLDRMTSGNVSLMSDVQNARAAIQAAVTNAFKTPEVLKLFASKEPALLRGKLETMRRDLTLGKISQTAFAAVAVELMVALRKMGEVLSDEDAAFLEKNMSETMRAFDSSGNVGAAAESAAMAKATQGIRAADG